MFDFFREIGEEISGIDSNAAKKERLKKKEEKERKNKENCFLFTRKAKSVAVTLGVLYIVLAGNNISTLYKTGKPVLSIAKYILMSLLAVTVIISLVTGKKKGEIVAIISIFLFVCGLLINLVLLN